MQIIPATTTPPSRRDMGGLRAGGSASLLLEGRALRRLKYTVQLGAWVALTPLAFFLRLEGEVASHTTQLLALLLIGLPLKAIAIERFGLHRRSWRRAGITDLLAIALGVMAVTVVLLVAVLVLFPVVAIPRSLPLIEGPLALLVLGGAPFSRRVHHEQARWRVAALRGGALRVLVVGAGETGQLVSREMRRHPEAGFVPVGFLDDDRNTHGLRHGGLAVLGCIEDLPAVVAEQGVDEVLIALPTQLGPVVRRVVALARTAGVPSRILPPLRDIVSGRAPISAIRDVNVEDLLGRAPVRLDLGPIEAYLRGRTVLITGAGGSIGSEIVRQIAGFDPACLVLLGRGEYSVFEINRELARTYPDVPRHAVICDVRDEVSLAGVFERFKPDVVFHAAAHKHVGLMEENPAQAVLNNVGGIRNVTRLALAHGVSRFVNVSTDKAVNPTSVMGATKRVAEAVVTEAARQSGPDSAFISVRFGNVLGSRGSVIPLFKEQIQRGGPITVTDPDMIRYFMTIPEAAQLVLQAGAMGLNGRVCVLDMGEPVRIVDLARDLILLSGLEPGTDVAIEFSGQRQGEKLYEELLTAEEGIEASRHEKIYVAKTAPLYGNLIRQLERLFAAAATHDGRAVRTVLQQFVPLYSPDPAALAPAMGSGEGVHGLTGSGDGSSGDGSVRLEEPTLVVSKGARAPA